MICSHCGKKPEVNGEYFVVKDAVATCASCEIGLTQLRERLRREIAGPLPSPLRRGKGESVRSPPWRPKGGS